MAGLSLSYLKRSLYFLKIALLIIFLGPYLFPFYEFQLFLLVVIASISTALLSVDKIGLYQISIFLFILLMLLNAYFSLNRSLSIYPLCNCILFLSIIIIVSYKPKIFDSNLDVLQGLMQLIAVGFIIGSLLVISNVSDSHGVFKTGKNYVASYGCIVFPFLLFSPVGEKKFYHFLLCSTYLVVLLVFCIVSDSRAAILSLFITCPLIVFFWTSNKRFLCYVSLISISISLFFLLNSFDLSKRFELLRLYDVFVAIDIFCHNPIIGTGLGTWSLAFEQVDLSVFNHYYLRTNELVISDNHNLISKSLAEVGLPISLLIVPFFYLLHRFSVDWFKLRRIELACFVSIIFYLILSLFYRNVTSAIIFSKMQLIFSVAVGVLINRFGLVKLSVSNSLVKALLISLLSIAAAGFVYIGIKNYNYRIFKSRVSSINRTYIHDLASLYDAKFFQKFKNEKFISHQIADKVFSDGNYSGAITWYKTALKESANSWVVSKSYALCSLRAGNLTLAYDLATDILNKDSGLLDAKIILVEYFVRMCMFDDANCYIREIRNSSGNKNFIAYANFWTKEMQLGNNENRTLFNNFAEKKCEFWSYLVKFENMRHGPHNDQFDFKLLRRVSNEYYAEIEKMSKN